jgi:uncharacterized protein YvpB
MVLTLVILVLSSLFSSAFFSVEAAYATNTIPSASKIPDMPVFAQQRTLSCEYSATRAAVARWGVNIEEHEFINAIGFNANPHIAFRGNINGVFGGTTDYGIYPEPIALFLNTRGFHTKLLIGGLDELKAEIAMGRPVVVWVPAGAGWGSPFETSFEGANFKLMPYEHAVNIYGYNEGGVFVADPGFGTYDFYSWDAFSRAWSYLDNMAMSIWPAEQGYQPNESLGISPYFYRQWLLDGGLEIYGYPITMPQDVNGKVVQYFERARMEYTLAAPRNQPIALGLLGRELTDNRPDNHFFKPVKAPPVSDNLWYFVETGHTLSGAFLPIWLNKSGMSIFGFPISEPFVENGQVVQYFERARFELVPGTNDRITLGLLGTELLARTSAKPLSIQTTG